MRLFIIVFCLGLTTIVSISTPAMAVVLLTTQDLTFGEGIITDNTAQRVINLASDGSFTNDPEFLFVTNPQQGIYQMNGGPKNTAITVTVVVDQQPLGPGEDFVTDNFDIDAPAMTNGAGKATINLGARLTTTGTGTDYTPASLFTGQITITVSWVP